jgi:hypothetical protein
MSLFDPRSFLPISPAVAVLPEHGPTWRKKWPNWWGGATIASPTTSMTAPALHVFKTVKSLLGDLDALNEFYVQETQWARSMARDVLQLPGETPVFLDASGTAAILNVSRLIGHVALAAAAARGDPGSNSFWTLTTDEGGSLVPATLRGKDPNQVDAVMFQPNSSLFYQADPVMPYPVNIQLSDRVLSLKEKSNDELVAEIRRELEKRNSAGLIVLPQVSKTGRILPVKEVGALVAEFRSRGLMVYLMVDAIQAIGRLPSEEIAAPLSYCDAYMFGSAKALGGLLTASATALSAELLVDFVAQANACAERGAKRWFCHFQFSPEWQARLDSRLLKLGAVSLPEVASMRAGLFYLYTRGSGADFAARRQSSLAEVRVRRRQVVEALSLIEGVSVLCESAGCPLVPSIVCVRFDGVNISPGAVKEALQAGDPIITPSAPINRYLRLDIPEYRAMPSVAVLVTALRKVLSR